MSRKPLPLPLRLRSRDGVQSLISIQALRPICQLNEYKLLARQLTFTEIGFEQRGDNVRLDITWVTFYQVVIGTLVKLCAQAIDVGCSSTEPETREISF